MSLENVTLDPDTNEAEMTLKFVAELTQAVRNAEGEIVEGSLTDAKKQKDTWVFSRHMGSDDPNWFLVSTDG